MTYNQISRAKLEEDKRHNAVMEAETNRSNIARESETHRSNVVNEALGAEGLEETRRTNKEKERISEITALANKLKAESSYEAKLTQILDAMGWEDILKKVGDLEIGKQFINYLDSKAKEYMSEHGNGEPFSITKPKVYEWVRQAGKALNSESLFREAWPAAYAGTTTKYGRDRDPKPKHGGSGRQIN